MSIFTTLLTIVLGVASVVLLRKANRGASQVLPGAIICSVLTVLLALGGTLKSCGGGARQVKQALQAHEQFQVVCGAYVGRDLVRRHPGARVVILVPDLQLMQEKDDGTPRIGGMPGRELLVNSLREAMGEQMASVEVKELSASLPREVIGLLGQADVVISTIDFLDEIRPGMLPRADRGPPLVLLNAAAGVVDVDAQLEKTVLDSVVLYQSGGGGWKPGSRIPDDLEEAFAIRYRLVTVENPTSHGPASPDAS